MFRTTIKMTQEQFTKARAVQAETLDSEVFLSLVFNSDKTFSHMAAGHKGIVHVETHEGTQEDHDALVKRIS